jgi:hypothetical protein
MKNAWHIWLKISRKLSAFLATILLTIIYIILFIPFSVMMQVFFRRSLKGHGEEAMKNSFWIQRKKVVQDLTWAQRQ